MRGRLSFELLDEVKFLRLLGGVVSFEVEVERVVHVADDPVVEGFAVGHLIENSLLTCLGSHLIRSSQSLPKKSLVGILIIVRRVLVDLLL